MPDLIRNPDILTCLSNLSNDEVFTPPEVANAMLDLIPEDFWTDPNVRVLDPACKSGVFLREAAKRFLKGEEEAIPDLQERIDHIFHKQLFGYAITELTSHLSRRTVYCSKTANGKYSVTSFKSENGNIAFSRVEHSWVDGKCKYCGASQEVFDRGEEAETHAYKFIHLTSQQIKELDMKFDLIIGNPPYQLNIGVEKENYAIPIYQKFVEQAKKLKPRYLTMIIPARWFTGGRGLEDFRKEMLNDQSIRRIVDYPDSKDCFPGVDISGGVCYFLWDRDNSGRCEFFSNRKGNVTSSTRKLNEFGVFVRFNEALSIIHKVAKNMEKGSLDSVVGPQTPFGFITTYHGQDKKFENSLSLHSSFGITYVSRSDVSKNLAWVDKYKVIFSKATCEHAGTPGKDGKYRVFSTMDILEPDHVCSQSYLVGGCFDSNEKAKNYLSYLKTSFVRFLLLQALTSQDISREKFLFVPMQDFSKPWTDEELYEKYGLTEEEIAFIESMIKPME